MNRLYQVLYYLSKSPIQSQRSLAKGVNMSLGYVNSALKELEEKKYIEKKQNGRTVEYKITKSGQKYLENILEESRESKLTLKGKPAVVEEAVILAAGSNQVSDTPVGLLDIEGMLLIDHMIRNLTQNGIYKIYVVVGYEKEKYQEHFKNQNVTLLENLEYKWTGTMASLKKAADYIKGDFLLLDGNQILEESAISEMLNSDTPNSVLVTSLSNSGDEAYVEFDSDQNIFRISKDIHQMNHIDGEMVGVSRISRELYDKMLEYYESNTNPFLSYEYVLESIGRLYSITGTIVDDLIWCVIENEKLYHKAAKIIYPKIKKRQILRQENHARETLKACLQVKDEDIQKLYISGGMTNNNFRVKLNGKDYILRIPGACTDVMINRRSEQHNSALASAMGLNPNSIYFNPETGVKITEYIPKAETLSGKTARLEMNIKKTTALLRTLHRSEMKMYGEFNITKEYEKYKEMMREYNAEHYEGFEVMDEAFYEFQTRLSQIGLDCCPCHNDLVAENLIKDKKGRLYLIDWEYSGYGDPMLDLAAHFVECEFLPAEEELFLNYYRGEENVAVNTEKIQIYKILLDILWSAWTASKESQGEDFGSYGPDRLLRAVRMTEEYKAQHGHIVERQYMEENTDE